jgi:hypothetical protein
MLQTLINAVKSVFKPTSYASELEQFIVSNNPQNNSHVESLEREFDRIKARNVWAGGLR